MFESNFAVKPLSVAITGAEHPFLSGEPSSLDCVSYGSRPAANITWYHDGRVIEFETKRIKVQCNMPAFKQTVARYYLLYLPTVYSTCERQ